MKKTILLLIISIFTISCMSAQYNDTAKFKLLEKNVENIQLNLKQHYVVYKAGWYITALGAVVSTIGIYYDMNAAKIPGAGLLLLGTGVTIYSHVFIKKAGTVIRR